MSPASTSPEPSNDTFKQQLAAMMERFEKERQLEDEEEKRNSLNGVPWHEAPLPPRIHKCFVQTRGWIGFDEVHRCACGAIRNPRFGGHWLERNSSRVAAEEVKVSWFKRMFMRSANV